MRILVCIASYGVKNEKHLKRIFAEYRRSPYELKIVVVSDRDRKLSDDIEVKVGLPIKSPHSLPFAHRKVFKDNLDKFDLFIYSEDDILITDNNIKTFLELNNILPFDTLSGFMRYEIDSVGKRFCPDSFSYYSWILNSVEKHGDELFAGFSNLHSAAYMITRPQLNWAINSGGYLVEPHHGDYDLECSAATDIYTQCGFKRLLCISRLEDILLHHLGNRYIGLRGISFEELNKQIDAIKNSFLCGKRETSLFQCRKNIAIRHWDKQFYEELDEDIIKFCEKPKQMVLSIGAGYGGLEEKIKKMGHQVIAIPVDHIMATSLQFRGIEITMPNIDNALKILKNSVFDCVIISNVLQHLENPERFIDAVMNIIQDRSTIIIKIHNYRFLRWKSFRPNNFKDSNLNCIEIKTIYRWFRKRKFNLSIIYQGSKRVNLLFKKVGPIMASNLARSFVIIAKK